MFLGIFDRLTFRLGSRKQEQLLGISDYKKIASGLLISQSKKPEEAVTDICFWTDKDLVYTERLRRRFEGKVIVVWRSLEAFLILGCN